ncbi:hypothetical protein VTI28DRAFT_4574 [Corynascus sepedonium]
MRKERIKGVLLVLSTVAVPLCECTHIYREGHTACWLGAVLTRLLNKTLQPKTFHLIVTAMVFFSPHIFSDAHSLWKTTSPQTNRPLIHGYRHCRSYLTTYVLAC